MDPRTQAVRVLLNRASIIKDDIFRHAIIQCVAKSADIYSSYHSIRGAAKLRAARLTARMARANISIWNGFLSRSIFQVHLNQLRVDITVPRIDPLVARIEAHGYETRKAFAKAWYVMSYKCIFEG